MIKLGMIGAGYIAAVIAETVRMMNESGNQKVELYGVASRSLEKADRFAKENGVRKAYGSYEELMEDPEVGLIYIAVPHSHHYEVTKRCLEHGKPVLVEKAFTVNAGQAEELVALARQKRILITEAIWTRYQPMRKIINDTISSGVVGEPKMLEANLGQPISEVDRIRLPELAGGTLLDMGVYPINFAEMVFGRAAGVTASCSKNEYGMDMNDAYTLTFADGKIAVLHASAEAVLDSDGMIYCTEGFIRVRNVNNPEALFVYDKDGQLMKTVEAPAQLTGYEYEVEEAVDAIEAGLTECASMPHEETIHVMRLMDEIRRQLGITYSGRFGHKNGLR